MALKINFSQDEANSEVREVPPSGEYVCSVNKIEWKEVSPQSANAGKPYWNVHLRIMDGKYTGSMVFSNIMLFEGKPGTLSSLAQFMKATGHEITAGAFELPDIDDLTGKKIVVRGTKKAPEYKDGKELRERFNVTGFKKYVEGSKVSSVDSRLP